MKEYLPILKEVVDECVSSRNCKKCPFAMGGIRCIIGQPCNWQLADDMEAEGYWDLEGGEDE